MSEAVDEYAGAKNFHRLYRSLHACVTEGRDPERVWTSDLLPSVLRIDV